MDRDCNIEPGLSRLEASFGSSCSARICGARNGLYRDLSCNRIDLGPPDLGVMVGMGRAADKHVGPIVPLRRLSGTGASERA